MVGVRAEREKGVPILPEEAELKKLRKMISDRRKRGEECYTDEELENAGFLVEM